MTQSEVMKQYNLYQVYTQSTILLLTCTYLFIGPPLSPIIEPIVPMARNVTIRWTTPFSLLPISSYTLVLSTGATFNITNDNVLTINETHIRPFTNYSLSLNATNPAGNSQPALDSFESSQDSEYMWYIIDIIIIVVYSTSWIPHHY